MQADRTLTFLHRKRVHENTSIATFPLILKEHLIVDEEITGRLPPRSMSMFV